MSAGAPLQRPAQQQPPPPSRAALPQPRASSVIPPSAAAPSPPPFSPPPPPSPETALLPLLKELLPLYLPERELSCLVPSDPLLSLVAAFSSLFTQHHAVFLQPAQLEQHRRCLLPFPALCRHTAAVCPDFASELAADPVVVLPILSAAAHVAVLHLQQARILSTTVSTSTPITARITAHAPLTSIRSVRSHLWNRLVTFRANVVKVGPIRQLPSRLLFRCSNCKKEAEHQLKDGRYSEPQEELCKCPEAWRRLTVDRVRTVADDWQQVRLQEILVGAEHGQEKDGSSSAQSAGDEEDEEESEEGQDGADAGASARSSRGAGGLIPRYFDCELRSDLVDSCMPGDVITVTGVIKPSQLEMQYAGRDRRSGGSRKEWSLFLDVNALNTLTRHQHCSLSFIVISDPDLQRIAQVLSSTAFSPFKLLVHSLCPAIFGHELVKAGLLLTLLGGNSRDDDAEDGTSFDAPLRPTARSNPHILIVGDPGLGKSQMLKAVNAVSPRGVLVTGNTSTASGLTVTMLREGGSADGGDYTLEAGALVLGDSGTTCVDEFDKLHASQHSALLEAMEQQTISIAKAGMIVTLPARTSVFAAANPQHGHYNRSRSVSENIKLPAPLLSRFDLVFVLVDDANECKDEALSKHVMKLHAVDHSRQPSKRRRGAAAQPPPLAPRRAGHQEVEEELAFSATQFPAFASDSALLSSLRRSSGDGLPPPLPPSLLRLYIAYARRYIQPVFTDGAKSALYHFYLSLRQDGGAAADGPPITTRQLQSMIRLCQARAKAEMRSVVEEADAQQVIELMRESMREVMEDEDGVMDWRRRGAGGRSGEKDVMRMMKTLGRRLRLEGRDVFSRAEVREMAAELGVKDVEKVIGQLNEGGWLLQQAGDRLKYREAD